MNLEIVSAKEARKVASCRQVAMKELEERDFIRHLKDKLESNIHSGYFSLGMSTASYPCLSSEFYGGVAKELEELGYTVNWGLGKFRVSWDVVVEPRKGILRAR